MGASSARYLNPSEAARRLGVSAKALRLYEARGLIRPARTRAGWRAYGPQDMRTATEVAALRALGFSLAQVVRVLSGDADGLEPALSMHQARLEDQLGRLRTLVETVRSLRSDLAQGKAPTGVDLVRLAKPVAEPVVAFDLPWPWGGERFELRDVRAINYIIGPLGSGKTRLARGLAGALPNASFLGLERVADGPGSRSRLQRDAALRSRVDHALAWLREQGAQVSDALVALLVGLETEGPAILVVDLIEHRLDQATQEAVIAHLKRRGPHARTLFVMTRSSSILDLAAIGPDETIILCPANHSPPMSVAPYPGAPGFEAVATCLASPDVRARTEGMIAWRPSAGMSSPANPAP